MRVAVLGSWRQETAEKGGPVGSLDTFQAVCRRIGRELIERGHSLIVGSMADHTADGNALKGAREVWNTFGNAQKDRPRVMMVRLDKAFAGRDDKYRKLHQETPGFVVDCPVDTETWSAVKLFQTHLADALVLVGGAQKTEQAGLAAIISKKPLACIGSFGGAAYALNRMLAGGPWTDADADRPDDLLQLQSPWHDRMLTLAFERAGIEGAPKLMLIHGRSTDRDILKDHLQRQDRRVVVLADEFDPTQPIPIKFERAAASVDGAIALVTPDDLGMLGHSGETPSLRARENVWVEVGWFWGRRGRSKLLLLIKAPGNADIIPSDLRNVEHYTYEQSPINADAVIQRFLGRLRAASDR